MRFWLSCGILFGVSCGLTKATGVQEKKAQLDKVQQTLKEMAEIDHWQASASLCKLPACCAQTTLKSKHMPA